MSEKGAKSFSTMIPAHRTWPMFVKYLREKKRTLEEQHGVGFVLADTLRMILAEQDDFEALTGEDQKEVIEQVLSKTKRW